MIKKYVEENEARMLEELFSLIRIPSVSAQPALRSRCRQSRSDAFKGQPYGLC